MKVELIAEGKENLDIMELYTMNKKVLPTVRDAMESHYAESQAARYRAGKRYGTFYSEQTIQP